MKILFFTFAALLLIGCSQPTANDPVSSPNAGAEKRGAEITAEFLKRDSAPFRKSRVRFTTTEEGQPPKIYELDTWRAQSDGETKTLTRIVKPAEDADLASLTIESEGKPTVVTSYVASRGEFRETDTNKIFFGGLTAGELLGEWGKFDYKFIEEKTVDGQKVYEIEGNLKKGESGLVQKMFILMGAENYVPVELRLFDNGGRHIRTYRIVETKSDAKGAYAAKTEVENLIYRNKTIIEVLSREFPATIDASFFERAKLKEIATKSK
ncbi:MAG: outer membrane lipoprotein-sorting protein [Pyrinomonadaceae bacterium]